MTHIIELAHKRIQEIEMAKAKTRQAAEKSAKGLPVEVAQIQFWTRNGCPDGHSVRYTDMELAKKQFAEMCKRISHPSSGRSGYELTGANVTTFVYTADVSTCSLLDTDANIYFVTEAQKRANARMLLP